MTERKIGARQGLGSAASGGLELTTERNEEDEDRLRGERSNGRNGEGGEKKKKSNQNTNKIIYFFYSFKLQCTSIFRCAL